MGVEDAETGRGGDAERTGESGSVTMAHRERAASVGYHGSIGGKVRPWDKSSRWGD